MPDQFAVILAAAGKSTRFAAVKNNDITEQPEQLSIGVKKTFAELCDKTVWEHSAALFFGHRLVRQIIVVLSPEDRAFFEVTFASQIAAWSLELVNGGNERFESIEEGIKRVRPEIDFVAIHDAARPCVTAKQIDAVFSAARQYDAAILASPVVGTIKRAKQIEHTKEPAKQIERTKGAVKQFERTKEPGTALLLDIVETVPRDDLWEAQTPQVFRQNVIKDAFARRTKTAITDDAQLLESLNFPVKIVPSDRTNLKITTPIDLLVAEQILKGTSKNPLTNRNL